MRHATLLVLLAALAGTAIAGTGTVTWTPATACTDGFVFPATARAPESIEFGTCTGINTFGTSLGTVTAPSASTTSMVVTSNLLTPGGYFAFRVYTNLNTTACGPASPIKSAPSAAACKTIPAVDHGGPNPPASVTLIVIP